MPDGVPVEQSEAVDLKAMSNQGAYLKLSVAVDLSTLGYEGTKVRSRHLPSPGSDVEAVSEQVDTKTWPPVSANE